MPLRTFNPYTGAVVCEFDYDEEIQLEDKIAAANMAFRRWRKTALDDRIAHVRDGLDYFRSHREQVAREITQQMGKPIEQARREVDGMLQRAECMIALAPTALAPDRLEDANGCVRRIEHVPHGVVFNLSAWNYPLLITVNVVVPAILAGNTVLLKHSARTPLCGQHFARAFGGDGIVSHLILDHPTTAIVASDPRIAHIGFTGSVQGGTALLDAVRSRFIDVGLELGGKDPAYIAQDADLDGAVAAVVDGALYNAGQSCCGVERVYVHRDHYDTFLQRAEELCKREVLGDPLDPATTMGPLAAATAIDTLELQVEEALERGAELICGGKRLAEGQFFPPTIVANPANDTLIMQEESFGPLIPVAPVDSDEDALIRMNHSDYGLTASIWTRDRDRAERLVADLECGTVYQNRCDYLDPALPWTGVKDSGRGSTLSKYGLLALTRRRSVMLRD